MKFSIFNTLQCTFIYFGYKFSLQLESANYTLPHTNIFNFYFYFFLLDLSFYVVLKIEPEKNTLCGIEKCILFGTLFFFLAFFFFVWRGNGCSNIVKTGHWRKLCELKLLSVGKGCFGWGSGWCQFIEDYFCSLFSSSFNVGTNIKFILRAIIQK